MTTVELTLVNCKHAITSNDIIPVDFWANWCGPSSQFGIRFIPILVVFREKILLFAQAGVLPAYVLESLIEQIKTIDMVEVHTTIAVNPLSKKFVWKVKRHGFT